MEQQQQPQPPQLQLPTPLLARILFWLPQKQRLTDCAVVNRQWATAAGMGTVHMYTHAHVSKLPNLSAWLQKYGQQVESLSVWPRDQPTTGQTGCLQLCTGRLPQLTSLMMHAQLLLQLPPTATTVTPTTLQQQLPKLRHVRIEHCTLDDPSTLLQLTSLSSLTHFELLQCRVRGAVQSLQLFFSAQAQSSAAQASKELSAALGALFRHLPQLAKFGIRWCDLELDSSAWQHLSSATSLTSISISLDTTRLLRPISTLANSSNIATLTALQSLSLSDAHVHPNSLDAATRLQKLSLVGCKLLALAGSGWASAAAVFLAAVARMASLTTLELGWDAASTLSVVPPEHFSALTRSSQLRKLMVCCKGPLLSSGAASAMFPHGKQLPHLTSLCLVSASVDLPPLAEGVDAAAEQGEEGRMSGLELGALVSSCPNLRELELRSVMQPGAVSPLLALTTQCVKLTVGGWAVDDAAASIVCRLSRLQSLELWSCPVLTDVGLVRMTALTALTYLSVANCMGCSPEVVPKMDARPYDYDIGGNELMLTDEDPAPVWLQLRDRCVSSPQITLHAKNTRIEQLQRQVDELQERNTRLEEQGLRLEQRNTHLEEQGVRLEQRTTHLEEWVAQLAEQLAQRPGR